MSQIPLLTPQDARHFYAYFSGVASALAKRFTLGFQPDEEHLTSLLCELLDSRGATMHALEYSVERLNTDLAASGSLLHARLSLETNTYTKHQERHDTQSDLGIILDYRDHVDYSLSFRKAILVQAKKLFPISGSEYSLASEYSSFDAAQHNRLIGLRNVFNRRHDLPDEMRERMMRHKQHPSGNDALMYLLYNPPLSALPRADQDRVVHAQLIRDTDEIYDFTQGLFLHEHLSQDRPSASILSLSSIFATPDTIHSWAGRDEAPRSSSSDDLRAFSLGDVVQGSDIRKMSFAWYLVFGLLLGNAGSEYPEFVSLVEGRPCSPSDEIPPMPPRYVLRVGVEAGMSKEKQMS